MCSNLDATRGPIANMTRGQVKKMTHVRIRMRHVKHESETWASRNMTRGRLVAPEFQHVAFP